MRVEISSQKKNERTMQRSRRKDCAKIVHRRWEANWIVNGQEYPPFRRGKGGELGDFPEVLGEILRDPANGHALWSVGSDDKGEFDVRCLAWPREKGGTIGQKIQLFAMLGEVVKELVLGEENNDFLREGQGHALLEILQGNPKAPRPRDPVLRTQDHEGTPIHRLGFAGGGSPVVA